MEKRIKSLKSQELLIRAIELYDDIRYFWFIGGYRSGKSFTIVQLILSLAIKYQFTETIIGIGSPTISLAKKTFLLDLEILLTKSHIAYHFNHVLNILTINEVKFIIIAIGYPTDIYAYTFNAFLCDEIDELSMQYGSDAFTAIDERCSKTFPDGRPPFCAYFTTAQGHRTVYAQLEELKHKNIAYIKVRGQTKDNYHNDPSYYTSRYALYSEQERLAYLDGHIVDLLSGRVYGDFHEAEMTVEPFDIADNETVYVGQDKNIGWNKAVCYIKKDKILYMVKSYSFQAIQDAPRILRNDFPTQDIFWYPDVTAKEIIAGYASEIKGHNINLRVGTTNPSILGRIFLTNKIYKSGKCKVFRGNNEFCIAMNTRSFDKNGMPKKEGGEKDPSHMADANEYVLYRLIMYDPDFAEIKNIANKIK